MSVSVIIPVLNEAGSIGAVLEAIPWRLGAEVIVVDGGSGDGTPEIAREHGARVLHEPRPGYGYACAAGATSARGQVLTFMDGDGSDDPQALESLVAPLEADQAELVIGSRLAGPSQGGAMPWHQRWGSGLAAWAIGRLYGLPLTDVGPYRAIKRRDLMTLDMVEMRYGWTVEMTVKAARRGWRVVEVPVPYRPRQAGKPKIIGTMRGTLGATVDILSTVLRHARD